MTYLCVLSYIDIEHTKLLAICVFYHTLTLYIPNCWPFVCSNIQWCCTWHTVSHLCILPSIDTAHDIIWAICVFYHTLALYIDVIHDILWAICVFYHTLTLYITNSWLSVCSAIHWCCTGCKPFVCSTIHWYCTWQTVSHLCVLPCIDTVHTKLLVVCVFYHTLIL